MDFVIEAILSNKRRLFGEKRGNRRWYLHCGWCANPPVH